MMDGEGNDQYSSQVIKSEDEEEEEQEASLTDVDVDLKEEQEDDEEMNEKDNNDETTSLKIVQVTSANSSYSSGNRLNQQQSNTNNCLVGEDNIEVSCKKCSTDFSSLKLFLDHLHKKPHQHHVISQTSKENQPPSNTKVAVVNSTSFSSTSKKVASTTIINKTTGHQNSSKNKPEEESTSRIDNDDLDFNPETSIDSIHHKSNSSSSSSSESEPEPDNDLDLDADPNSDPLQLNPSDIIIVPPKYKCTFCDQNLISEQRLKAHLKKIIPRTKCNKADCPMTFTMACALIKHNESHRKEFECQANTQKNSPKTYSRAHRTYSTKPATTTTTTTSTPISSFSSFAQAFSSFVEKPKRIEPRNENMPKKGIHPFECNREKCPKYFDNAKELRLHIFGHDMNEKNQKYIRCPYPECGKPFPRRRQMYLYNIHVENHKRGIVFKCKRNPTVCSKEFERFVDLNRHEVKCKPPVNTRLVTNYNITKPKERKKETKFTSNNCPFCPADINLWFPGKHSFVFHIKKFHPEKSQEDIDKALEPPYVETPSKKFKCTKPECAHLEFVGMETVRNHNRTVHLKIRPSRPAPPKPKVDLQLPCKFEDCGWIFKSEIELRKHTLRVHDNVKNHLCAICGKAFLGNARLKEHEETHNDARNFKCDVCEQFFKTKETLARHKITHTDQKQYLCFQCGRAFRTSDAHNVHMRLHTEERRFKCPICPDVGYNHKVTLKEHMKKLHPEWEGQL